MNGNFRGAVDDRIERQQHEVDGHDLDHRTRADQRGADAEAGEAVFRDRRIAHAPFAVFGVEPLGHAVAAAVETDILAEREHRLVGGHFVIHGAVERLPIEQFLRHGRLPYIKTSWRWLLLR